MQPFARACRVKGIRYTVAAYGRGAHFAVVVVDEIRTGCSPVFASRWPVHLFTRPSTRQPSMAISALRRSAGERRDREHDDLSLGLDTSASGRKPLVKRAANKRSVANQRVAQAPFASIGMAQRGALPFCG